MEILSNTKLLELVFSKLLTKDCEIYNEKLVDLLCEPDEQCI
jgi:hypothetical protein